MVLKDNLYYWHESLKNPEPIIDDFYIYDEIVLNDENLIDKVWELRNLITAYCVILKLNQDLTKILENIRNILINTNKIQYTEFTAFWKVLDISYSIFIDQTQTDQINILNNLLKEYCEKRLEQYNKLGYTNVIVQSLYDNGASRKKGVSGIEKLVSLLETTFEKIFHIKNLNNIRIGYFLPDNGDENLFKQLKNTFNIQYKYGQEHQEKNPDMVLIINNEVFIIEAKHIKESGGAQDKQVLEIIDFIKYNENQKNIHYLSFMDGIYFNKFILDKENNGKAGKQKNDIEVYLNKNKNNFFVNTHGLSILLKDIK